MAYYFDPYMTDRVNAALAAQGAGYRLPNVQAPAVGGQPYAQPAMQQPPPQTMPPAAPPPEPLAPSTEPVDDSAAPKQASKEPGLFGRLLGKKAEAPSEPAPSSTYANTLANAQQDALKRYAAGQSPYAPSNGTLGLYGGMR